MIEISYNPDFVVHPGESLSETLEVLNMSQVELSERTGLTTKHISHIIKGKASITPETAIKLERVLGVKANFWNNLEKNYRSTLAKIQAQKSLENEIETAKKFSCYNELAALGVVEKIPSKNYKEKAEQLLYYFRVDSLSLVPCTEGVAFRNKRGSINQESLAAWLRYGEIEAEKIIVKEFSPKKIKEALTKIKELTTLPEGFDKKVQDIFAECGVAIVFAPYFKNTKINGATRWVGDKPVIQLNIKNAYADIFWFTLFHEVGHLILHNKKDQFLNFSGEEDGENAKEKEADNFAVEHLISPDAYEAFKKGATSIQELGVDKSIIAGRLAHEGVISWAAASRLRTRLKFVSNT